MAVRAGDVVPYVFCLPDPAEPTKTSLSDRARHPDDVRRAGSELKIGGFLGYGISEVGLTFHTDFEYYIANQVLPPIERLCDPIEGTERTRLAECLGTTFSVFISCGD